MFGIGRYAWPVFAIVLWAVVTGSSLYHYRSFLEEDEQRLALARSRMLFNMIETTRLWNAEHGGVYVRTDARTPPNPYLRDPQRDVLINGEPYTKVNPAYMTRQLSELLAQGGEMRFNITSLKPIRPQNQPDDWERDALARFEGGEREVVERVMLDGEPQYRYMAALSVGQSCLKCHANQGYKIGDLRGGISVTLPARLIGAELADLRNWVTGLHLSAFLLLSAISVVLIHRLRTQTAQAERDEVYRQMFATNMAVKLLIDPADGAIVDANDAAVRFYGYPAEVLKTMRIGQINDMAPEHVAAMMSEASARTRGSFEFRHRLADGSLREVEVYSSPLRVGRRALLHSIILDVTEMKAAQREVQRLNRLLQDAIASQADGFAIFDSDDRLVLCNQSYVDLLLGFDHIDQVIGKSFADLLQAAVESGKLDLPDGTGQVWAAERLARHLAAPSESTLVAYRDGRWVRTTDRRTSDGGYVQVRADVTELKSREQELEDLNRRIQFAAHHDELTGLPNRRLLADRLAQAVALARRSSGHVAVLCLDLDGFKPVNDCHGHAVGDSVLRRVAEVLAASVRAMDTVARSGGDEFTIVLPILGMPPEPLAQTVAERVIAGVAGIDQVDGVLLKVGVSVGISIFPGDATTADELMILADQALYAAKHQGKNRFVFHLPEPQLV